MKRLKHKKTILLQNNCGKERMEDYPTPVALSDNRSKVVFQYWFTMTSYSRTVLLCFQSFLVGVLFTGQIILFNLLRKILPLVHVPFLLLLGSKLVKKYSSTSVILILEKTINGKDTVTCSVASLLGT